jgi:large conductance mechanosensitive channel
VRILKKLFKEFKAFAMKGNVLELATGVIIATTFGKIVTSLVNDIIMPLLGLVIGNVDLGKMEYPLVEKIGDKPAVTLRYGAFLQTIMDFLIIAVTIFLVIKTMTVLRKRFEKQKEETPPAPVEPTKTEALLEEIRDLLKEK